MIRDAIVTGKIAPGERLTEGAIANEMGVSRSPVREAFRQLEQEGLITSVANQGSFVRTFDDNDVREIFILRSVLEDLACQTILQDGKLKQSDFDHLASSIQQQERAVRDRDFDRLTSLDMDFHEYICAKSGLGRLLKMWRSLRAQVQVLFYQRFEALAEVPQTVATDHAAILEALRDSDATRFSTINKEINARVAEECIQVVGSLSHSESPTHGRRHSARDLTASS